MKRYTLCILAVILSAAIAAGGGDPAASPKKATRQAGVIPTKSELRARFQEGQDFEAEPVETAIKALEAKGSRLSVKQRDELADLKYRLKKIRAEAIHWPLLPEELKVGVYGRISGEWAANLTMLRVIDETTSIVELERFKRGTVIQGNRAFPGGPPQSNKTTLLLRGVSTKDLADGAQLKQPDVVGISGVEETDSGKLLVMEPLAD